MLKELSDKDLLAVAKKLNIFHPEKMKRAELENAIAHITGEEAPNKIKQSSIKIKQVRKFNGVTAFLVTFILFDTFSIVVPLVLHFAFNGNYSITTLLMGSFDFPLTYESHHLYIMVSLNVVSLIWTVYVGGSYMRYERVSMWVLIMYAISIGYGIYFLIGIHDTVAEINEALSVSKVGIVISYSPELDHYVTAFGTIVGISSSFVVAGAFTLGVTIKNNH